MPVTIIHRLAANRALQWERCRDACEGSDAVKLQQTKYLPKLSSQDEPDYKAYLTRAMWYGASGRTVHALTGSIMRIEPKVEGASEQLATHLDDVTLTGQDLCAFAQGCVREVLTTGRTGVLLDMPAKEVPGTQARPYWVQYQPEQIINWHVVMKNGIPTLTMVVLKEEYEVETGDAFGGSFATQFRVLKLDPQSETYMVDLYKANPPKETSGTTPSPPEWQVVETLTPKMRGDALKYIPFVFINALTMDADPQKPPLFDLVDVNFSHYCNSADLEHGRHFTALPTPWITGMPKTDTGGLSIGSARAWLIPNENARVGMLEFDGQGLGALEKALDAKERLMVILGARMLEESKLGVESAEALQIRGQGEVSTLAAIAGTTSVALTRVAQWHAEWIGSATEPVTVELNKDFHPIRMTSQDLQALVAAWQGGAMSYDTLYHNLQQGELTRPDITADEERELIDAQTPEPPAMDLDPESPTFGQPIEAPANGGKPPAVGGGRPPFGVKPKPPMGKKKPKPGEEDDGDGTPAKKATQRGTPATR